MVSGVEAGTAERLEDRGLAGFQAVRPLQDHGGLGVVAPPEQVLAAAQERVRRLAVVRGIGIRDLVLHGGMVPRVQSRQVARSSVWSRGLAVIPGMRPRLAIGLPSISLMSPVKSMGVAPEMYDPTANESTGAPASLK